MKKILLIDDESRMLDLLELYLIPKGYFCIKKSSAFDAIEYLDKEKVDLVLLDVMMPEMNGWDACQEIKKHWDIPIIMLTARTEKADVVRGLKLGADDYISKPFDEEELLARIEAVIRRNKGNHEWIEFHGLLLKEDLYELSYQEQQLSLTPKEFALMSLFLKNRNKVFSREHLLSTIWGYAASTEDRTIDSHVRNLRDKLRKVDFPVDEFLHTVWGVGYKWLDKQE